MSALTLLIVGKYFLPIFLRNEIYTMPQFLEQRYGTTIRTLMAVFWLALYIFVNLTSIIWLGSIAVNQVTGLDQDVALIGLGVFALLYQIRGGLKAVALTDIVQVTLLVMGGLIVSYLTLSEIGGGQGVLAGFATLADRVPEKFDMILSRDNPFYQDLPGISVLIGGMWIANLSYWGFNQYIIQRALAAKSLKEAQKGVVFAAYLKLLMPVIIVLPGIAAVVLAPDLAKPDQAYPTMMRYLPSGLLGLVFSALVAAIVASTASKINSISTIFTLDLYAKAKRLPTKAEDGRDAATRAASEKHLVLVGRIAAAVAIGMAIVAARPLIGQSDQAFQFIQEFSGFFTPGHHRSSSCSACSGSGERARRDRGGGGVGGAVLPAEAVRARHPVHGPDADRVLHQPRARGRHLAGAPGGAEANRIRTKDVDFGTTTGFNVGAVGVILILIALYATWW
jgi:SSS family solute:Na+ symporter